MRPEDFIGREVTMTIHPKNFKRLGGEMVETPYTQEELRAYAERDAWISTAYFNQKYERVTQEEKVNKLDALIKVRDGIDKEIENALLIKERFGANEDWADESVIFFKLKFVSVGTIYRYCALKAAGRWFVTGAANTNQYLSFDDLVSKWLSKAEEVWVATEWREA